MVERLPLLQSCTGVGGCPGRHDVYLTPPNCTYQGSVFRAVLPRYGRPERKTKHNTACQPADKLLSNLKVFVRHYQQCFLAEY